MVYRMPGKSSTVAKSGTQKSITLKTNAANAASSAAKSAATVPQSLVSRISGNTTDSRSTSKTVPPSRVDTGIPEDDLQRLYNNTQSGAGHGGASSSRSKGTGISGSGSLAPHWISNPGGKPALSKTFKHIIASARAVNKGYLMKRGRRFKTWKKRWFILTPGAYT